MLSLAVAACGSLRPPPLPPAGAARPLVYVVSFPKTSTAISWKAAAIINSVAADANRHRWLGVEVAGPFTKKRSGYDPGLAGPRMTAVVRALAAAGIDEKRISRKTIADLPKPEANGTQKFEIRLVERPVS